MDDSGRSAGPALAEMDHGYASASAMRAGFPRPRGDSPIRSRDRHDAVGFPALVEMDFCPVRAGCRKSSSPAHAEMHPQTLAGEISGFRPSPPRRRSAGKPVARVPLPQAFPPTRRSTARLTGQDPIMHGLPRPRGDGPLTTTLGRLRDRVPPPKRKRTRNLQPPSRRSHALPIVDRSTLTTERLTTDNHHSPNRGFPAHAEIDHGLHTCNQTSLGFPRPRGDRPYISRGVKDMAQVSPPTRR